MSDKDIISDLENELSVTIDVKINKYGDVAYLDLSSKKLKTLPQLILKLEQLEVLDISNNSLTDFSELFKIKSLGQIDVSKNKINKFPKISHQHNLEILDLSNNKIKKLDPSIELLARLDDINLSHNEIEEFPDELIKLKKIVSLKMSNNHLSKISKDIGKMRNLHYLMLNNNQITELPASIGQLSRLWVLDVTNNPIRSLPDDVGNLSSLGMLRLKGTKIEKLPDTIQKDTDISFQFLLEVIKDKIPQEKYIEGTQWIDIHKSITKFWQMEWESSEHRKPWSIRNLLDSVEKKVTSETLLNYLVGCNDLDSGFQSETSYLTDEQRELKPLWFVEFPLILAHGEKYLKIRLNNLIYDGKDMIGYPNGNRKNCRPIKRIKLEIETPGFKKQNFDHLFAPNTEIESLAFSQDSESTWLTDIVYLPLENQSKLLDNYSLTYNVTVYFDDEGTNKISSTNIRFIIPILRKNNIQNLEKLINTYPAVLALIISLISMVTSILSSFGFVSSLFNSVSNWIDGIFILVFIFIIVSTVFYLLKSRNNQQFHDRVQSE